MIVLAHVIFITGDSIAILIASDLNRSFGIFTRILYVVIQIVNIIDNGFNQMPAYLFFGKVTPQGVESTMTSILTYFLTLNIMFRQGMGIQINEKFVHVTRTNMDNYIYLKIICVFCDFIPFLFMFKLTPTLEDANNVAEKIA